MIGILNQHKGDFSELLNNISDFEKHLKCDKFIQVYIIDQEISNDQLMQLEAHKSDYIKFIYNETNLGLSPSRKIAAEYMRINYGDKIDSYYLNSTNSTWLVDLTEEFYETCKKNLGVTVFPVSYEEELTERDYSIFKYDYISTSEFISNLNRPDVSILVNADKFNNNYELCDQEKYIPEELFIYKCAVDNKIRIVNTKTQTGWYNPTGLSRTFSRGSVYASRKSYLKVSEFFIDEFLAGRFYMSYDRLKIYVTNLVVLSDELPIKKYKNTLIGSMLMDRLYSWSTNESKHHKIKFTEDYDT